jgi:two-component system, LytTR family, response regulator
MTTIRTLIVDDEPLAIEGLEIRLAAFDDVEVVGSCPNGRKAIEAIRKLKPDLVLLDIQMPGLSGFDVVKTLVGSRLPLVVFVTAFDEHALKAFEAHALDYLLKPVDEGKLRRALQRARKALHGQTVIEQNARLVKLIEGMQDPPAALLSAMLAEPAAPRPGFETHISIKDRGRITRIAVEDIGYIDAASDYMCIHVGDKTHILRATMKDLEKRLDPVRFQRVHRSAIVNTGKVKELKPHSNGEYFLFLEGGGHVKVSRSYKSVIARFL